MDDVRELIERLEKATGPDRNLDYEIAIACVPNAKPWRRDEGWYKVPSDIERDQWSLVTPLPYTASIDAAMTLVPEGCPFTVTRTDSGRHWAEAGEDWQYDGATPAIAFCIAALRARAIIAQPKEPA